MLCGTFRAHIVLSIAKPVVEFNVGPRQALPPLRRWAGGGRGQLSSHLGLSLPFAYQVRYLRRNSKPRSSLPEAFVCIVVVSPQKYLLTQTNNQAAGTRPVAQLSGDKPWTPLTMTSCPSTSSTHCEQSPSPREPATKFAPRLEGVILAASPQFD